MTRLRIVLAEMPQLLADILKEAATKRTDTEILGWVPGPEEAAALVRGHRADAVITGADDDGLARYRTLLCERPRVSLVCIEDGGRRSRIYRAEIRRWTLGSLSPAELLQAVIRTGGDPESEWCRGPHEVDGGTAG